MRTRKKVRIYEGLKMGVDIRSGLEKGCGYKMRVRKRLLTFYSKIGFPCIKRLAVLQIFHHLRFQLFDSSCFS